MMILLLSSNVSLIEQFIQLIIFIHYTKSFFTK